MTRRALLVTHTGRPDTLEHAGQLAERLRDRGFGLRVLKCEALELGLPDVDAVDETPAAGDVEIIVALGGDGTLLRAAEIARPAGTPLLGIKLGRVAFLAEAEIDALDQTVNCVADRTYEVDERLTVDVTVSRDGAVVANGWALNEAAVEKATRERMIEVLVSIDGRPLSRWGCDGVVCATPTGSTAYAFSAGGPVVWPEVEALLLVPNSAHALFSRPLVTAPTSVLTIEVAPEGGRAVLTCDGRRTVSLEPASVVEVRRGANPVRVVRLHRQAFTDRLVKKFRLPVDGWRGRSS
jgi:NAD+ kinase